MPELPEVETIARGLAPQLQNHRILAIEKLDWQRMVKTPDLPLFRALLPGRTILHVGRRAKWLLLTLDEGWTLTLHLRMSGRINVFGPHATPDQHTHLVLQLTDAQRLFFRDPRKFGRVQLLTAAQLETFTHSFGPEPLAQDFTVEKLATILTHRTTALKPLLLNQQRIAGLGNIYVDESLWHAQLHPMRPANTLQPAEVTRLHTAIRTTLEQAIAYGGSTLRDYRDGHGGEGQNQQYFSVYAKKSKPCPRCNTPIERILVAQRGTHLCPVCQQRQKETTEHHDRNQQ
jgi:formamidopyrimidine-DNA glycosylase